MNHIVEVRMPGVSVYQAAIRAAEIYDFLGRSFFDQYNQHTDEFIINRIADWLVTDAVSVRFNDKQDALLFKLTFGGQ